ncbi:hypothetical protein CROQUDRAFT_668360 [Cronartium quercuum f. sp. fusiforme G11]|uniref:Fe2OG dioxygenase domain-containing protein n=1 Tax=Cronartium quercuum f. sp. fusiforme G11 TaxID=708437 RepID=A0A9P6NP57_9BASI|nr:hypothetical protein CROQUDRAFT_668360 [Cronartium quercuum f. sp. fusiforme G11]
MVDNSELTLADSTTQLPNISSKKLAKLRKQHLEARARVNDTATEGPGAFRRAEKYYKTRLWDPDYKQALGGNTLPESSVRTGVANGVHYNQLIIPEPPSPRCEACGGPTAPLRLLTFPDRFPGLIYLPSYLCEHQQRALIADSLETSLRPPNVTNIDTHWTMPEGFSCGLFDLYRTWRSQVIAGSDQKRDARFWLQPRASLLPPPSARPPQQPLSTKRVTVDLEPITAENYLTARNELPKQDPIPSETVKPIHVSDVWMKGKLRWCTIGWQYHWTTKTYHFEREPTPISELVSSTCIRLVNQVVPWELICPTTPDNRPGWRNGYRPEAGVINFYQYKDSLTAHIDHSEVSLDSPLVSLSIGNSCVFLIGPSREDHPLALRLESGDALIMAGESRRFFHGVPRIIENSLPSWLAQEKRELWAEWFKNGGRINLNVRQVF